MKHDLRDIGPGGRSSDRGGTTGTAGSSIGKRTRVEPWDQEGEAPGAVTRAAAHGTSGPARELPHGDRIQALFGRHDVGGIRAHVGGAAAEGAARMGAQAFATGDHVAFAAPPDLRTAAHEAAHVVQQRGGVQLQGGVGDTGDAYERHADAVADRVVQGRSAESLLDQAVGGTSDGRGPGGRAPGSAGVQRMIIPIGDVAPADATPQEKLDAKIIRTGASRLQDNTGGVVEHLDRRRAPLHALRDDEDLTIVAHGGNPSHTQVLETFGDYTPAALAAAVVESGLPPSYSGTIYLNGCNTATASPDRTSYVERFQAALLDPPHEIRVAVRGNRGGTRILEDGQTGFRKEDATSQERRRQYSEIADRLLEDHEKLQRLWKIVNTNGRFVDEELFTELGIDENTSNSEIVEAAEQRALLTHHEARGAAEGHLRGNDSDELYEPRPDLITTLPRPPSHDVFLIKLTVLVAAVMGLALTVSMRMPKPYGYFCFLLGIGLAVGICLRALRRRPG